jgi:hypothetical protein
MKPYTKQQMEVLECLRAHPGSWCSLRYIIEECPCNSPTKPLSVLYDKGNGVIEKRRDPLLPTQMQYRAKEG